MATTLISFIIVLGVIIFVHELGHFLAAKAMGARVEVFSIGFPPNMVGIKHGETEYRLGWVPLGGYVKIAGMIDESFDAGSITGAPDEFMSKSVPAKILIITAGVLMNFLLGFLIFTSLTLIEGKREFDPSATVGSLSSGFPAVEAGILRGDRILSIDSTPIGSWEELTKAVHPRTGDTLFVVWLHDLDTLSASIPTRVETIMEEGEKRSFALLGLGPNVLTTPATPIEAVIDGGKVTWRFIILSLEAIYKLITRQESLKAVAGPVGIMQFSGESARAGISAFVSFIAFISVSIGLLNILPFPMLDGGHLVYIFIEAIIRRPVPTKIKLILQQVGIALIFILLIVVTYNDLSRIFVK